MIKLTEVSGTEKPLLTDVELDLVFFIERFAASAGSAPTKAQIHQRWTGLTDEWLDQFAANPLVQKSFKVRGIVYPPASDRLTDEQMHAIATMLDPYDRRSDEKKLRDLGITTRQWAMWMLDEEFATYVRDRSERLLNNSVFEAHKGMIKGARNGNVAAVKMLYEVTGRYRPNEESQVDVRRILHSFIEVIQRYIKDPIVLHNIAMDMSQLASAEDATNNVLSGAQAFRNGTRTVSGSVVPTVPVPQIEGFDND